LLIAPAERQNQAVVLDALFAVSGVACECVDAIEQWFTTAHDFSVRDSRGATVTIVRLVFELQASAHAEPVLPKAPGAVTPIFNDERFAIRSR